MPKTGANPFNHTSTARVVVLAMLVVMCFLTVSVSLTTTSAQAMVIKQTSGSWELWLNRGETWSVGYQSTGAQTLASRLPSPYSWLLKGYLWLLSYKARQYYAQGRSLLIAFPRVGWWVSPTPVFTGYWGG